MEPNISRSLSIKRKCSSSIQENEELWKLVDDLRTRPDREAADLLKRIRATKGTFAILDFLRYGNIDSQPSVFDTPKDSQANRLRIVDEKALKNCRIKVRARPWTTVAGDGLVSELISYFFDGDHTFLTPYFEEHGFIKDMETGGGPGMMNYCSPLLVNMICAAASVGIRIFASHLPSVFFSISAEKF